MSQLTKNFNLKEFAVSADFPELAAKIKFNEAEEIKAYYLSAIFLQPVRDKFGPVKILSGKRTQELNEAIPGASPTSDHLFRYISAAVDFTVPGADMKQVFVWMQSPQRMPFGQLTWYADSNFIHVSMPTVSHYKEAKVIA